MLKHPLSFKFLQSATIFYDDFELWITFIAVTITTPKYRMASNIIAFFIITSFTWLHMMVGFLHTRRKRLYDRPHYFPEGRFESIKLV
jgi:hypothetical protein